jgi:ribose-phosphate pyrophosphokinase
MSEIEFVGSDNSSEPISFVQMYSDGTPMVKTLGWQRIVDRAHTMILRPSNMNQFVVAMFLVDAVESAGGRIDSLILPYVPGARQDRSNPTGDVLFTAKSVAAMINQRDFSRVVVLDPHSPVITNEINDAVTYPLEEVMHNFDSGQYDGVIAPDDGATVRGVVAAQALGKPVYFGWKHRDVSNGKIIDFGVQDLTPGGHYIVVDDICDGGGTFIGLGEKIKEQGATADLFVSHGIFSKGTGELKKYYNQIYTTDSRQINERNKVTIIPVVKEMENYYV